MEEKKNVKKINIADSNGVVNPNIHHSIESIGHKKSGDCYIERTIVDCVKKTGPSDEDFVIGKKVIDRKYSISDTINSQVESCSVENYVKRVEAGLDAFAPVIESSQVIDHTGGPSNVVEAINIKKSIQEKLDKLPSDLVGGRTAEQFLDWLTEDNFNKWLESKNTAKKDDN